MLSSHLAAQPASNQKGSSTGRMWGRELVAQDSEELEKKSQAERDEILPGLVPPWAVGSAGQRLSHSGAWGA